MSFNKLRNPDHSGPRVHPSLGHYVRIIEFIRADLNGDRFVGTITGPNFTGAETGNKDRFFSFEGVT